MVAVFDSSGYVHADDALSDSILQSIVGHKQAHSSLDTFQPGGSRSSSLASAVEGMADNRTVMVDCSTSDYTLQALCTRQSSLGTSNRLSLVSGILFQVAKRSNLPSNSSRRLLQTDITTIKARAQRKAS